MTECIERPCDKYWTSMKLGENARLTQKFYLNRVASVSGWMESEYICFMVNNDLRQGCRIFPWVLNIHMDAVVKEVYDRIQGKTHEMID